jgi:hypothetical protein
LDNKLEFPDKLSIGEDLIFMYRAHAYNPLISVLNRPIYNYYNRIDSASKGLKTLKVIKSRLEYMRQTKEYQKMPRHIQLWIDDSFVGTIFLCIANLRRHKIPLSEGIEDIYNIYTTMFKYNPTELENCRNFQGVKEFLINIGFNQPL